MKCNIFSQFPAMKPWIGKSFHNSNEKLLIVGESHFLPPESTIHHDPVNWYRSSQNELSQKEIEWISTSDIISFAIENNFKIKTHWIYKNIALALNSIINLDEYKNTLNFIAFTNYFKRPAIDGDSLIVKEKDASMAKNCLLDLVEELNPTIVLFTSSLSGKYGEKVIDRTSIPYFTVPHPTCQWWNRTAKKYYGNTGKELFIEFLKDCHWRI